MKHEHQKIYVHEKTGRFVVETVNSEPSMCQQQFAEECDINNIMKKYASTGEFTHHIGKQGMYADFSGILDYHDMVETVRYADEAFALLPANVRSRFRNDPGELLAFMQDPSNYDEAMSLGLLDKDKGQETIKKRDELKQRDNKVSDKSKKSKEVQAEDQ